MGLILILMQLMPNFDGEFGDRRQEIVIIGVTMDQKAIEAALDSALLTDDEMKAYKAKNQIQ